jgi:hypothetical protein
VANILLAEAVIADQVLRTPEQHHGGDGRRGRDDEASAHHPRVADQRENAVGFRPKRAQRLQPAHRDRRRVERRAFAARERQQEPDRHEPQAHHGDRQERVAPAHGELEKHSERRAQRRAQGVTKVQNPDGTGAVLERQHAVHGLGRAGERRRDGHTEGYPQHEQHHELVDEGVQPDHDRAQGERQHQPEARPDALDELRERQRPDQVRGGEPRREPAVADVGDAERIGDGLCQRRQRLAVDERDREGERR